MEVEITRENFESLKNGEQLLVVDFWAEWCGPCKMIAPTLSQLAEEYEGKVIIGKCNVEENEDLATEYSIRNIPTLLFFKKGQMLDKFVGAANKMKLKEKFDANL
jgi:thioredoxin 1